MRTADFDYELPQALIAQRPTLDREASRLMVVRRNTGEIEHWQFRDLPRFLKAGDVLVHNDSRVIPARLFANNIRTDGRFEILLLEENSTNDWWAMLKPGRRARVGTELEILDCDSPLNLIVKDTNAEGHRRLLFRSTSDVRLLLGKLGTVPLPPYITRPAESQDHHRYQTVYASVPGSVAAPTAGLHFTESMMRELGSRGINHRFVTLHVGIATFAPVKVEKIEQHVMHEERFVLPTQTAAALNEAKMSQNRVLAVGTTSLRVLETVAAETPGPLTTAQGRTSIFIRPPYNFRIADGLLTNFHLPRSTLLMLVSAFVAPSRECGRELVLRAYREAIHERYRFFSYGDAMLIL